ncbi:unnamed protein product [Fusarium graminearum]|uniref:Chromosome 1, complete genome n=1 Tax=Gibberella zeae (strain ATCC MYA-4620 / CBS 123657 / FGSC 9075 / NRRL 31084 / PH-1) TaxID=229533 RepID=A0A0E0RM75_GIBZE|nr:hypothetical protein FG05_30159 [Fusarium graminearum]CEF72350.1 unnamed protein product [Fusarium graminearum]CZS75614.1 unnamed protein product [Fusarium graminearum]
MSHISAACLPATGRLAFPRMDVGMSNGSFSEETNVVRRVFRKRTLAFVTSSHPLQRPCHDIMSTRSGELTRVCKPSES